MGGLIRRFLEECLQLPAPAPLLQAYNGLEGTPHFQLLRSVAKEWSYCKNATHNYTTMGGKNKRQRATSRLIETFENIDGLRAQLSQLKHELIVAEVACPGLLKRMCHVEATQARKQREQHQKDHQEGSSSSASTLQHSSSESTSTTSTDMLDVFEKFDDGQLEVFNKANEAMKQLRKFYFDQSRRLAVRISQLKKGRQVTMERIQRAQTHAQAQHPPPHGGGFTPHQSTLPPHTQHQIHQQQPSHILPHQQPTTTAQLQQMQQQLYMSQDGGVLPHQINMHLHQPWSD